MRGSARIARAMRDALALPARELHAALADDRVVALLEPADELVAVREPARPPRSRRASRPAARTRCCRRRCRRTGSCPAGRCRAARGSRAAGASPRSRPSMRMTPDSGRLNAITRLMSVLLPDPLDPTSAVVVPAGAWNETSFSTGDARRVREASRRRTSTSPWTSPIGSRVASSSSSVAICADFANAIEPGEGLADLRADRRNRRRPAPRRGR